MALNALVQRWPRLSLNADPSELRWNPSLLIHGVEALPVRY